MWTVCVSIRTHYILPLDPLTVHAVYGMFNAVHACVCLSVTNPPSLASALVPTAGTWPQQAGVAPLLGWVSLAVRAQTPFPSVCGILPVDAE